MDHLSLTSPHITGTPQPKDLKVQLSTSSSGDVRKVRQIFPLPPKFDQPAEQINIKDLVSDILRQVTQSVVGQLARLGSSDTQADSNIRQALAAARRRGPTATTSQPDNIQAILRAAKAGGLKAPTSGQTATQTTCGPPVAPVRPQQEQDTAPRGCPGRWNLDPLGLQADITAQQRERGRERRTGSAKRRSGSRPRDEAKRGRQTPSSDDSGPGIDWTKNKIGPAKWESTGQPKSPVKSSHFPGSGRSNTQPSPRYSQSCPTSQSEKKEESSRKEKAEEKQKKLEEDIVKNYPGTYMSNRIVEMISERFTEGSQVSTFLRRESYEPDQGNCGLGRLGILIPVDPAFSNTGYSGIPSAVLLWIQKCSTRRPSGTPPHLAGNRGCSQKEPDVMESSVHSPSVLDG